MSGTVRRIQTIQPKIWFTDWGSMYSVDDIDNYLKELVALRTENKRLKKEINGGEDTTEKE